MSFFKGLTARAASLLRGRAAEARMDEEFDFHIEMETRRLVSVGVTPDEARRRALATFGGMDAHREAMRDERGARLLHDVWADVLHAFRAMRRNPFFAIAVALTLGIGIGVNGAVFGYVNSILLRPLPVRHADRLVGLFNRDSRTGDVFGIAYEDFRDFRFRSGAFDGLAGAVAVPLNVVAPGSDVGDMVWAEMVTENYFSVLEMQPAAGRFFTENDAPQGSNQFVVLSYESWRRRFNGDSAIAGRVLRINGTEFVVTGVAPPGFRGVRLFGFWPEMWVPIGMHAVVQPGSTGMLTGRGGGNLTAVGRMRFDSDRQRTGAEVVGFARQLEISYPASNANISAMVVPAKSGFENPRFVKPRVLVLSSALGVFASLVILAIIGATLANLQIARMTSRAREIAIRLSLGCSRGRLLRQLLVESAVFALPGLMVALVVVKLGALAEPYLTPRLQFRVGLAPSLDGRVAMFTAAAAVAAIIIFGLVPALRAGRVGMVSPLANVLGASAIGRGGHPSRLRNMLVVGQIALSVILLIGGMLFVRSLMAARTLDLGFESSNRALISMNVGLQGYDEQRGLRFYDQLLARVRSLDGVTSAALVFPAPFDTYDRSIGLYVEGVANSRDGVVGVNTSFVSEDFTRALGLRLEVGRDISPADTAGAPLTMVVSRSLATRLWPGKDPLGQRARRGGAGGPEITVVGVVSDARFLLLGNAGQARAYVPVRQRYRDWETLVVHTAGRPASVLPKLRAAMGALDPALPAFGATTMDQAVASGLATSRTAASVAGFFGLLALLIATVGLYGVVAGNVTERTREMGLRMALGSTPRGIVAHLMRSGARLGAIGLAIGLAGAFGVALSMRSLLYGLSAHDPFTFVAVPLALMLVVAAATYLPARRAAKLNPVAALKQD